MGRIFNTSADCQPELHYMVDITERLRQIKTMVDAGQYFTINRARQYGKTTTLQALREFLKNEYIVISMDFQMLSASKYKSENIFSVAFAGRFIKTAEMNGMIKPEILMPLKASLEEKREELELPDLFEYLSDICGTVSRPVVLMMMRWTVPQIIRYSWIFLPS